MTGDVELMLLRLAFLLVLFAFLIVAAAVLRASLQPRPVRAKVARLVVVASSDAALRTGHAFAVAGTMLIGRSGAAGIVLPDGSVSAIHAEIQASPRGWLVRDLGSLNGTLIAGVALESRQGVLRDREELTVGSVRLRLEE